MAEPVAFTYRPLIGRIGNRRLLVQLFISPDTGEILHAQAAVENVTGGWSVPYPLEAYEHGNPAV